MTETVQQRAATAVQDADQEHADRQDIRLAVVLNGGVSLAVWISGVAVELHRLVQESRAPQAARAGNSYSGLLDVLQATARVDVIAGTSAGGLNGGFLSLGLVHGADLMAMRNLWADKGDLFELLRDPRVKENLSLLSGDYFHRALSDAYTAIAANRDGHPAPDGPEGEYVDLFLTGTLWKGRSSPFTDALGRRIVEVDHDAIFRFSSNPQSLGDDPAGDLRDPAVAPQLAVASRCTSSFPGAFEPFWVNTGASFGDCWESDGGLANFADSQHVVDGGILLNKPIRPALQAVYRQPASRQVRRLMAYVVPDPGEGSLTPVPASQSHEQDPTPKAPEVLLGVLTRLRSTDSVSTELAEIEQRNAVARQRRRTRDRVASALLKAVHTDFVADAYPAYRQVRNDSAANTVGELLSRGGRKKNWSRRELTSVLHEIAEGGFPFVPPANLHDALEATGEQWSWGQSEVTRLGDLVIDVLKRAVWLAPLGGSDRRVIVEQRSRAHDVIADIRKGAASLDRFWVKEGERLPERGTTLAASPAKLDELRAHLGDAMHGWEDATPGQRARLYRQARGLANCLFEARSALSRVAARSSALDPNDEERRQLADLVTFLLDETGSIDDVLQQMLRLQVVQVAFAGASTEVEQEVELFQVSSEHPELLTGIQEHHFGAFYRTSWRLNDWMRGRLDGTSQLVQMLLAPERLRQVGLTPQTAYDSLRAVAVGPEGGPYADELARAWDRQAVSLREELEVLSGDGPLPRTLPRIAARIAARLHTELLPEELRALADAVLEEPDPLQASVEWAREAKRQLDATPTADDILRLARGSKVIGQQRIRQEIPEASDRLPRVAAKGLATFVSMIPATKPPLVASTIKAVRGYALLVWVLVSSLTTGSNAGRNLVSLAVGVGGALLGLTLVMPGVPIGVTLVGAVLVLGAASATAITERPTWGRLGWRLLVPVVIVLAALVAEVWWTLASTNAEELRKALLGGVAKVGTVVAVVFLGWWIARARPPKVGRRSRPRRRRRTRWSDGG